MRTLLLFPDWVTQETDILEPSKKILFLLILLSSTALIAACGGKLSSEEKKRVKSALGDSLLAATETWGVDMEIIKNGTKKIHLTGSYAATFNTGNVNKTRIKGPVHIEIFDSTGAVKTRVNAKRAVYHISKAVFELFGDVDVYSRTGRTLHSEYLKWDQSENRIKTSEFVVITTQNDSLAGTGFRGTVDLSRYTILEPSGKVVLE